MHPRRASRLPDHAAARRAVFLDKDGTLVKDVPYNVDPARMQLLPGVSEGLRLLDDCGYALVVVSNQAGVAHGMFGADKLSDVVSGLHELLRPHGIRFTAVYFCPHSPDGAVRGFARDCACRKPAPGLLLRAARRYHLDLEHSWLIGDILNDVQAGHRAGCKAVLVDNGNETEWQEGSGRTPDAIVANVAEAARFIVRSDDARRNCAPAMVRLHA